MTRPLLFAVAIDVPANEWMTANGRIHPMQRHRRTKRRVS